RDEEPAAALLHSRDREGPLLMVHDPELAFRALTREHADEERGVGKELDGRPDDSLQDERERRRRRSREADDALGFHLAGAPARSALAALSLLSEEIEPKLGELQTLVVELPEEILETSREQRDALEDPVTVDIGHERGQLVGDVLEGRLARVPDEHRVLRRADGLA